MTLTHFGAFDWITASRSRNLNERHFPGYQQEIADFDKRPNPTNRRQKILRRSRHRVVTMLTPSRGAFTETFRRPSPGVARSICSNTTPRSVAGSLCRNNPPSPAVARDLYSNTMASCDPSAETPNCHTPSLVPSTEKRRRRHPASRGHSIVTPRQMSWGADVRGPAVLYT